MAKVAEQKSIITQVQMYAELCSGNQQAYYRQQLADLHKVTCVELKDVFSAADIARIKTIIKPQQKQCFRNGHLLTALFPDRVQYVEGYVTIFNGAFPIEHAWNKVGDKYVDITFELAFDKDVTKELYMALGSYNLTTITQITSQTGYYGSVYNQRFINLLKQETK